MPAALVLRHRTSGRDSTHLLRGGPRPTATSGVLVTYVSPAPAQGGGITCVRSGGAASASSLWRSNGQLRLSRSRMGSAGRREVDDRIVAQRGVVRYDVGCHTVRGASIGGIPLSSGGP